jgi:hypothetical protein
MQTKQPDIPAPSGFVPQGDTLSRDLMNQIIYTLAHDPLYATGCITDYEMLERIAALVAQRQQPAEGTIDFNTGLRY